MLSPLEADILGDMAWDAHGIGELAGFIRAASPEASDVEVFGQTRALLANWIERGWLDIGPADRERVGLRDITELLPFLDRLGPSILSVQSSDPLPEVDLTEQAFQDVEWLRGAV